MTKDTLGIGRLLGYTLLRDKCCICEEPAVVRVERSNKGLPKPYWNEGTRVESFCDKHFPEEIRSDMKGWVEEVKNPLGVS